MTPFSDKLQFILEKLSESLFNELKNDEKLSLLLEAEESTFIRLNRAKVRQNTNVEQAFVTLNLQSRGRSVKDADVLTLNHEQNLSKFRMMITSLRQQVETFPEDPFLVGITNGGKSSEYHRGQMSEYSNLIKDICETSSKSDLAAFYSGGPQIRASINSEGQNHFFGNERFFLDFSVYNGEKAATGNYSGSEWSRTEWTKTLNASLEQLNYLNLKPVELQPGEYRSWLSPTAVNEVMGILNWGACSMASFKRGQCGLQDLFDGKQNLSPHFSLSEDFEIGLAPRFNDSGELSPLKVSVIEKGFPKTLLTSSRSAKEYGVESNQAESFEGFRSSHIASGNLDEQQAFKLLGTGLFLSNLHYLNWSDRKSGRLTGMTRFACLWIEKGQVAGPINNLRFDESLYNLFGSKLEGFTKSTQVIPSLLTYHQRQLGGAKVPGALVSGMKFTL